MKTKYTPQEARASIDQKLRADPGALPSALLGSKGTMELLFYEPQVVDSQSPHNQDELYIVVRGSGSFVVGDSVKDSNRLSFEAGDVLFVPAGETHRFVDFTDDLSVWVVFWGAPGGDPA